MNYVRKHKIKIILVLLFERHPHFFLMTQFSENAIHSVYGNDLKVFHIKNTVSTHIGILRFSFKKSVERLAA